MKFKEHIAAYPARVAKLIASGDQDRTAAQDWFRNAHEDEVMRVMLYIHDMLDRPHSATDYQVGKLANFAMGELMRGLIHELQAETNQS